MTLNVSVMSGLTRNTRTRSQKYRVFPPRRAYRHDQNVAKYADVSEPRLGQIVNSLGVNSPSADAATSIRASEHANQYWGKYIRE